MTSSEGASCYVAHKWAQEFGWRARFYKHLVPNGTKTKPAFISDRGWASPPANHVSRFALTADQDVCAPGCLILMTPRKII